MLNTGLNKLELQHLKIASFVLFMIFKVEFQVPARSIQHRGLFTKLLNIVNPTAKTIMLKITLIFTLNKNVEQFSGVTITNSKACT